MKSAATKRRSSTAHEIYLWSTFDEWNGEDDKPLKLVKGYFTRSQNHCVIEAGLPFLTLAWSFRSL